MSRHAEVFNGRPTHEIEYLNYVIKEWLERLRQYPNKPSMIYGQTRPEAYASYAELVLIELKVSIAIAKGQYTKSLQDVEYKGKSHSVTVYKVDELPWNVVEYIDDGASGIMTRVYFYPEGYQDEVIFERAERSALVTGVAISDVRHATETFGVASEQYYRCFITSDPFTCLPGKPDLWAKRFNEHKTVMAISVIRQGFGNKSAMDLSFSKGV